MNILKSLCRWKILRYALLIWSPPSAFTLVFATDSEVIRTRLELDEKVFRPKVLRKAGATTEQLLTFRVWLGRALLESECKPQYRSPVGSQLDDQSGQVVIYASTFALPTLSSYR